MGIPLPPPQKGGRAPQIFGPCLLRPNGWMYEAGTWHGGRPQHRRLCVRWVQSPSPKRGRSPTPQFSAHFCCGQMAACIKVPVGMELGLGPGDFVLVGDPVAPFPEGGGPPKFLAHVYCHQTAGWMKLVLGIYEQLRHKTALAKGYCL